MEAQHELKIVGVHYAVNPTYNKEMGIVPEMEKHTVEVLRKLKETLPRLVLMPEPGNPVDQLAVMARVRGERIGYVSRFHLGAIHRILQQTGKPFLTADIQRVEVCERGNLFVSLHTEEGIGDVNEPWGVCDWSDWKSDLPHLAPKETWWARQEAEYMIEEMLYPFEPENMEELDAYLNVWIQNSLYDMSAETVRFCNRYIERLGKHPDERLKRWAGELEKHRTAFCGDKRTLNRMNWWKSLQDTDEMERLWTQWIQRFSDNHRKGLCEIDKRLRRLPADLYTFIGDTDRLFSALFYHDVPREVLWSIYSLLLLRERICRELEIDMCPLPEDSDEYGGHPATVHPPLPEVLTTPEASALLEKCRAEGLLDEWGQPIGLSYTEKGLLAKTLSEKLDISKPWCVFGELWGIKTETLRTSYNQAMGQRKSLKFQDRLKRVE